MCPCSGLESASQDLNTARPTVLPLDESLLQAQAVEDGCVELSSYQDAQPLFVAPHCEALMLCVTTPITLAHPVEKPLIHVPITGLDCVDGAVPAADDIMPALNDPALVLDDITPDVDNTTPAVDDLVSRPPSHAASLPCPKTHRRTARPRHWIDTSSSDDDDVWQPRHLRASSPKTPPSKRARTTTATIPPNSSPQALDGKHLTKDVLAALFVYPQEVPLVLLSVLLCLPCSACCADCDSSQRISDQCCLC